MPPRQWKSRLSDMLKASEKITVFCSGLKSAQELANDPKTFDACIRNFQILGDASIKVPKEVAEQLSDIPWKEIRGMRNLLVHEYFGIQAELLWKTIRDDLPKLNASLRSAIQKTEEVAHPWKICPRGEVYVREAVVRTHERDGSVVGAHPRRDHCRECPSAWKHVLSANEIREISREKMTELPSKSHDLKFGELGTRYDAWIKGWVRYWNEVFRPEIPLTFEIAKALIASESSFQADVGKRSCGGAKGLMQLMPLTLKSLQGYRNELKDHLFEFQPQDVFDPAFQIAAGIRWLFQKKFLASLRLKKTANWDEAVAEYKDYLRRRKPNRTPKEIGMEKFRAHLQELQE